MSIGIGVLQESVRIAAAAGRQANTYDLLRAIMASEPEIARLLGWYRITPEVLQEHPVVLGPPSLGPTAAYVQILKKAAELARQDGDAIGTFHFLLALLDISEGYGPCETPLSVLMECMGASPVRLREEVKEINRTRRRHSEPVTI